MSNMIKICWSPSSQKENTFLNGLTTNEADECKQIVDAADAALKRTGRFETITTWMDTLAEKCRKSDAFGADAHVCVHLNGFDGVVAGTRLFCGAFGATGHEICKAVFARLAPVTPGTSENIKEYPSLYEIRTPSAPTCYIEAEFYDSQGAWIIEHTAELGEAIAHGLCDHFGVTYIPPKVEKEPTADPNMPILDDDEDRKPINKEEFREMLLQIIREDPQAIYDALGDVKYATLENCPAWMQKEIAPMLEAGIIDGGTTADVNDLDINKRKSELTCIIVAGRLAAAAAKDAMNMKGHWVFVPDPE